MPAISSCIVRPDTSGLSDTSGLAKVTGPASATLAGGAGSGSGSGRAGPAGSRPVPCFSAASGTDPFARGWTLDAAASELRFTSVKQGEVAETSRFATFSGLITAQGTAQVRVLMESVETGIDLRNVRMRFLFFETFAYPEATITAQLDAAELRDLPEMRRKRIALDYVLTLHGITVNRSADVFVTLLDETRVAVTSVAPIALKLSAFGLEQGRAKLEEAADVRITPVGLVSFDFVFDRAAPEAAPVRDRVRAPARGQALDRAACTARLEALSQSGEIHFDAGSARLAGGPVPLLDEVFDVIRRCPGLAIRVVGHADSDGSAVANRRLSERRAEAVAAYLRAKGIPAARLSTVGFGETRPRVPNTSRANEARNRRIEFAVVD